MIRQVLQATLALCVAGATPAAAQIIVQPFTFPAVQPNANYGPFQLTATGVSEPNWSVSAGALPSFLSLNTSGIVSGATSSALTPGAYTFTARATASSNSAFGERTFTITVTPPLSIDSPSNLPVGVRGQPYPTTTFVTSGGSGAGYTYYLDDSSLPAGLSLSASGAITGTPAQTASTFVRIGVTDSLGTSSSRGYNLEVTEFFCPAPNAQVGLSYSSSVFLTPYTATSYSVSGGLPAGFSLNSTTGVLSGTGVAESQSSFTITALNANAFPVSRSCTLTVQSILQLMSPRTAARVGIPYFSKISASGGTGPYTYSTVGGSLPFGLTLEASSGRITGSPAGLGPSAYRARVQDSAGNSTERNYVLSVVGHPPQTPTLRCPLPATVSGTSYSSALSFNAAGSIAYSISGILPPGLTLNQATGVISGDVSGLGSYSFTASASASNIGTVSASCNIFSSQSAPSALRLSCPDQEDLVAGEAYVSPAIASGGLLPYEFSPYQSSLPPGLTLDPITGHLSGLPFQQGTYVYSLIVNDRQQSFSPSSGQPPNQLSGLSPLCTAVVAPPPALSIQPASLPNGTAGSPYSSSVIVVGGVRPYSLSISGKLPQGLVFNTATGLISGTPLQQETASFSLAAMDFQENSVSRAFTITIFPAEPLQLLTRTIDPMTVGLPFQQLLSASGGAPPYSFAVKSGTLAQGLSLSPGGSLAGTPLTAASYRFVVEVRDSAGASVEGPLDIFVFQGAFRLGCPSAAAEVGVPYSSTVNVLGGSPPYSFSIADGALPAGLSLNANTGLVSGRPTQSQLTLLTLTVIDTRQARTQTRCSITVNEGQLRILSEGPFTARAGEIYRGVLEAAGGRSPYVWTSLSAPADLALAVNIDGGYSGSARKKGTFAALLQVRDAAGAAAAKPLTFSIGDSTLSLACPASNLALGVGTNASFQLSGGLQPYALTPSSGALPTGLALGGGDPSGRFSLIGRPSANGDFAPALRAEDSTGTFVTRVCNFAVSGDALTIVTENLPSGAVAVAYSASVAASGAIGTTRWGLTGGSLPEGLEFNAISGTIAGSPLRPGAYNFVVTASDDLRRTASKGFSIQIDGTASGLMITTGSPLSDAVVTKPYAIAFAADGGKAPYEWSIDGALLDGLAFQGNTISGTPAQIGEAVFTVMVRDADARTASGTFTLAVKSAPGLSIETETLPDGVLGQPYTPQVNAQGGNPTYFWTILSGSIPPGVSFNPATGTFFGSPAASGQFNVVIQVIDEASATSRRGYSFEVRPEGIAPLQITTATLPSGSAGTAYAMTLGAAGGQGPYAWTVNGDLPPGIALNSAGQFSGTPQRIGLSAFAVTVVDSLGLRASRTLSLRIGTGDVPGVSVNGLPDTTGTNQNLPFTLAIASPFGVPVSGQLTLTFVPDGIHNADDVQIRFGDGRRTLDFTIPAGSTSITNATVQSGTLAGTIRIDSVLIFAGISVPGPSRTILIRRAIPVIGGVRLSRSAGAIEIRVDGYTNTRQLSEAQVTFTTAANVDASSATRVTINVQAAIQSWFASSAAQNFGGQFSLLLPFNVIGDPANITAVSIVVTNGEGPSSASATN